MLNTVFPKSIETGKYSVASLPVAPVFNVNDILLLVIAFAFLTPFSTLAFAASTSCPTHFVAGIAPSVTNPKLQSRTQEVCFEAFAVLHSGISRTPLYSAEYLTRQNLQAAKTLSRKDSFHAENSLPAKDRAELSDYARSGYDRGHMAPNANFANRSAQADSFSLANMVPQEHENNAGVWAGIESATRQLALFEGDLYVITGPAFIGGNLQKVGNVLVPTHIWKVLYSTRQRRAGAYLITNDKTREYSTITVTDLEKMVGLDLLPGVPRSIRDAAMELPKPSSGRKNSVNLDQTTSMAADGAKEAAKDTGYVMEDFITARSVKIIRDALTNAFSRWLN